MNFPHCHENEVRHCLRQSSSSHITISVHSVKDITKCFNKTAPHTTPATLGEQVVEKRVLQSQIKKCTTICFDQLCLKINQESEVQTEQFNKEDCQE